MQAKRTTRLLSCRPRWGAGLRRGVKDWEMKRRILGMCAATAALGSVAAVIPTSQAQAAELVQVCVTITDKFVGITVNGFPIGAPIEGTPRTCIGV